MKRTLIYGASGFCGSHIYNALTLYCDVIGVGFKNVPKGMTYSNVTKRKMVEEDLLGCDPDYVVFAAGNKKRDTSYKELYRDNVLPIKNIYSVIKEHKLKTRVIFISTDSVFSGFDGKNKDTDPPQPNTKYGKTKSLAEKELHPRPIYRNHPYFPDSDICEDNPVDSRIIRTSAVIGKGSLFLSWLMDNFIKKEPFTVYSNHYLSPTSIELLTNSIVYIMENWDIVKQPIIHICGKRMSRYQFAGLVAKVGGYKNVIKDTGIFFDTSMIPSDIQKKIIHKPMEEYLKGLICSIN